MGDVMSLIEKAEQQVSMKEAEELARKRQQDRFDLNDSWNSWARSAKWEI